MPIESEADHKVVSDAVAAAEAHTSGEIVTVLAEKSDRYDDIALLWAIAASFTAMSVFALFPRVFLDKIDGLVRLFGGWSHEWTIPEVITLTVALGLVKFVAVWAIQLWDPLKFWLVPAPLKTFRVHERAVRHFKVGAERRTHGRTGVLIYVSLKEHRAEIVADEPIAEKVNADVWGEAMADMLAGIRQGQLAEGIAAGVRDVGVVLAEHFPREEDDTNELPDRLIVL